MIYVFEDGRILYSDSLLKSEDEGKYLEFETMPEIPPVEGKVGVIAGCNLETKELVIEYFDEPEPEPTPEPTPTVQEMDYATLIAKINELTLLVKGVS